MNLQEITKIKDEMTEIKKEINLIKKNICKYDNKFNKKSIVIVSFDPVILNNLVDSINMSYPIIDNICGVLNKYYISGVDVYILRKILYFSELEEKLRNIYQLKGLLVDRYIIICSNINMSVKIYANRIVRRQNTTKITFAITNAISDYQANFWYFPNDNTKLYSDFERVYIGDISLENILDNFVYVHKIKKIDLIL